MRRLAICIIALSALGGLTATTTGAKAKKKCASKHENTGCVLTSASYAAGTGPGQLVAVIANARGLALRLRGNFCAGGGGLPISVGPKLKIGKTISFGGAAISGSIKVTAKSGTLTLKTHTDARPPNPNLGSQGSPACDTNQTFPLKRTG